MADDHHEPALPPGLAVAWGAARPGRRGPKAAHSVEAIVQAAMELADAGGLGAVSMPNVASRIGLATNGLYRYVSSKEELLVLLAEAGWGPPPESVLHAGAWRDTATAWVHAYIERALARPWLLDVPISGVPMTPNLLGWMEVILEAMVGARLTSEEAIGCGLLLDGYARSVAQLTRDLRNGTARPGRAEAVASFLGPRLREHGFPIVASIVAAGHYYVEDPAGAELDVDFGLDRILDGIAILIASKTA